MGSGSPRVHRMAVLLAIASALTVLLVIATLASRGRVQDNEAAKLMQLLGTVLPEGAYDNVPADDRILVQAPELGGSRLPVYRARRDGKPVAAVLTVETPLGYQGPIRLFVGITVDGRVHAVRPVAHSETPGLGDRIDTEKSDWLQIFAGRSASDPSRWATRRDGGDFDQITGATTTSRAVVDAVHQALLYFEQNRSEIFRRAPE